MEGLPWILTQVYTPTASGIEVIRFSVIRFSLIHSLLSCCYTFVLVSSKWTSLPCHCLPGDSVFSFFKTQCNWFFLQEAILNVPPYFLYNVLHLTHIQNSKSNRQGLESVYLQSLEWCPAHSTCSLNVCLMNDENYLHNNNSSHCISNSYYVPLC